MAFLNREEVRATVQAAAAVVGETEYKAQLDDNFAESVVFRKDVADTDSTAGPTKTITFNNGEPIDYITVTQSGNVTYTISNILQGEIKYLKITKSAGQTIAFAVATDVSARRSYINTTVTSVIYRITNKDGSLFVESINIDNDVIETKIIELGDWDMDADAALNINHGLTLSKIRTVNVTIRDDTAASHVNLNIDLGSGSDGNSSSTSTEIQMTRKAAGIFDSVNYDSTSFNRGWVTIGYVV